MSDDKRLRPVFEERNVLGTLDRISDRLRTMEGTLRFTAVRRRVGGVVGASSEAFAAIEIPEAA